MLYPPVEIYDFRAVLINKLAAAAKPVVHELLAGGRFGKQVVVVAFGHRGPVEAAAAGKDGASASVIAAARTSENIFFIFFSPFLNTIIKILYNHFAFL